MEERRPLIKIKNDWITGKLGLHYSKVNTTVYQYCTVYRQYRQLVLPTKLALYCSLSNSDLHRDFFSIANIVLHPCVTQPFVRDSVGILTSAPWSPLQSTRDQLLVHHPISHRHRDRCLLHLIHFPRPRAMYNSTCRVNATNQGERSCPITSDLRFISNNRRTQTLLFILYLN